MTEGDIEASELSNETRGSVVLHIGLGKTGTSAIQTWLARNVSRLAEQGVHYPTPPEGLGAAEVGAVTSGNAMLLAQFLIPYLRGADWSEAAALEWLNQASNTGAKTVLFSSEFLPSASEDRLSVLRNRIAAHGRSVTVVCALRDLGPLAFSDWNQRVKRSGAWKSWPVVCDEFAPLIAQHLDTYARVFGAASIRAINYESHKRDIVSAFMSVVSPDARYDTRIGRVNRPLSQRELALMLSFNGAVVRLTDDGGLRGALATRLSDHLLGAGDAPALRLSLTAAQSARLELNNQAALEHLNSAYLAHDPIRVAAPELVCGPLALKTLHPREEEVMQQLARQAVLGALDLPSLATDSGHGEPADRLLAHLLAADGAR